MDDEREGRTPAPTLPPPAGGNPAETPHPIKVVVERVGWLRGALALVAGLAAFGWVAAAYVSGFVKHDDLTREHDSTQAAITETRKETADLRAADVKLEKADIEQAKDLDWIKTALWFQIQQKQGGHLVPPGPPPP